MTQLHVVDEQTGELRAPGCDQCNTLTARVAGLEADLDLIQGENLRLIRQNKALKSDRDKERLRHRLRKEVEGIFREWQEKCGKKNSKLTAERFDAIVARLNNDYTREHFSLAIDGAANDPWRKGGSSMVEIATFCRRGDWFENYCNRGAEWRRKVAL